MENTRTVAEWKPFIKQVIDSKVNEFLVSGYSKATHEDVWACLVDRVWKGNPTKRLHEVTQDVLHLSSSVYMNFLTVNAYKDDDLMASISAVTDGK